MSFLLPLGLRRREDCLAHAVVVGLERLCFLIASAAHQVRDPEQRNVPCKLVGRHLGRSAERAVVQGRTGGADQLERLERLVSSDPDYGVDLHDGWTATVAFAHMAFWDRFQADLLRDWEVGNPLPDDDMDNLLNSVLERF